MSPFDKDGLIRVGGRIGSAYIPHSSKQQVIISNSHPIAFLLVCYIHVTNFHSGHDLTLNFFFFLLPFYFTRLDYFGPLTIIVNKGTRRTSGTAK